MILLDPRVGSNLLKPLFVKMGLKVDDSTELPFADACFEGKGPEGTITIGVERKTLHDMLHCIDDSRYGGFHEATWRDLHALLEARSIRLGAYGDPAAIPFEVWRSVLRTAGGWVAYSHSWRVCDQRLAAIAMASVDTIEEFYQARAMGWRAFRIRRTADEPLLEGSYPADQVGQSRSVPLEFVCPASDEANHVTTCQACQLCRGTSSPARNVVIVAHGKPSSLRAFGIHSAHFVRRDGKPVVKTCRRCGDDFQATTQAQLCDPCASGQHPDAPRQVCAGGCGRMLLAGRPDARCPDCILARRRERGRELLEEHRQRDEVLA